MQLIDNPSGEFKKWSTWALFLLGLLPDIIPQLAALGWFDADNATAGAVVTWAVRLVATWGLISKFINQTTASGVVKMTPQTK